MLEIQEMINEAEGRQLEILYRLKTLNKEAFLHMKGYGRTWKQKYHKMWSLDFWKEGKALLKEYFTIQDKGFKCHKCGKTLNSKFTIHHDSLFYKGAFKANMFTPLYIEILDNGCHYKEHKKK